MVWLGEPKYQAVSVSRFAALFISLVNNEKLIHTELCVVSDTHIGNIHQQLHLLNDIYEEAYKRGITTILHCGDMVDGNYFTWKLVRFDRYKIDAYA